MYSLLRNRTRRRWGWQRSDENIGLCNMDAHTMNLLKQTHLLRQSRPSKTKWSSRYSCLQRALLRENIIYGLVIIGLQSTTLQLRRRQMNLGWLESTAAGMGRLWETVNVREWWWNDVRLGLLSQLLRWQMYQNGLSNDNMLWMSHKTAEDCNRWELYLGYRFAGSLWQHWATWKMHLYERHA